MENAERSLLEMLEAVNSVLSEDNDECWFVTAWVGIMSMQDNHLYWCSAGHCEALLQDSSGNVVALASEIGLPLGLDERFSIPVTSALVEPGSRVHLYTDGITEHRDSDGVFLGLNGYADILQETYVADSSPASQCQDSADRVLNLNLKLAPEDDVTMLILCSTSS